MTVDDIKKAVETAIKSAPEVIDNKVVDLTRGAIAGAASADGPIPERAPPSASQIPPPAPGTDASLELWLARHARNDLGNARRLAARYGCDLTFCRSIGWLSWTGTHWNRDRGARAVALAAQATADGMYGEAAALELAGPWRGENNESFEKRIEAARKWARGSANANRIAAMVALAAPLLERRLDEFDVAPFLFNVQNGTLELGPLEPDGTVQVNFRENRRSDLITRVSPVVYDPEATECPLWRTALDFFLPDRTVQTFLQTFYGYSMTSSIVEQCVVLKHGDGSNFKSTMVDTIAFVLGDYAASLPISSLVEKSRGRGGEPSPDLARLPGARLVRAAEPPHEVALDESMIKQMTGGEPLTVRHLNLPFFDFKPTFKLVISFNRRPKIKGNDDGIWRRIRLVHFPVKIADELADREYGEKLKAEGPAILNWMIDGYRLWRERGLVVPDASRQATLSYRKDSDQFSGFLASACVITGKPEDVVTAKGMWAAYRNWCRRNGCKVLSQTALGRRLGDEKGVVKVTMHMVRYEGIKVPDQTLLEEPHESHVEHGTDADGR